MVEENGVEAGQAFAGVEILEEEAESQLDFS